MARKGSIFSRNITLYTEYYKRDLVGFACSLSNILSIIVWILVLLIPLIVSYNAGGKLVFIKIDPFRLLVQDPRIY